MNYISVYAMPLFIAVFVVSGVVKKVGVYECFTEGAKDGLNAMLGIIAPLVGLMVAIYMLRASGAPEIIAKGLSDVLGFFGMPAEVLPLAMLRPVSGSASLAVITDIFKMSGPDSVAGKIASVMMGSTETTFYTIAVYFGSVGIKNTRHTLTAALSADITGILLSAVVARALII